MHNKKKLPYILLFMLLGSVSLAIVSSFVLAQAPPPLPEPIPDYSKIVSAIDFDAIKQHVRYFSSLETRYTGSTGCDEAAQYIRDKFIEYGLVNVSYHEYELAVLLDHGANITFHSNQETLRIYSMRDNFGAPSTTPPEGVTGRLVYGKNGYYSDLDGLDVEGNIVILNWESAKRWLNVARLGGKAVIFLPPSDVQTYHVPETIDVPFTFPRFYVPNASAVLKHLNEEVTIRASTYWENVNAKNVLGIIPGTEYPDRYVLITAYYDSTSVFPSLAPGAQESLGVSTLLEIARWLSSPGNRPKYPVVFIAFSGHHQGLRGSYAFMQDYVWPAFNLTRRWIGQNILYQINIELSTSSNAIFQSFYGDFARGIYGSGGARYGVRFLKMVNNIANEVNSQKPNGKTYEAYFDATVDVGVIVGLDYKPMLRYLYNRPEFHQFMFDSEPLSINLYGQAWTYLTAFDLRPLWERPYDTFEYVNFENLKPQLELLYCQLYRLLTLPKTTVYAALLDVLGNDPEWVWRPPYTRPAASGAQFPPDYVTYDPATQTPTTSYNRIFGRVGVWNKTKAWYDTVPNALVRLQSPTNPGSRSHIWWTFTDQEGYFEFWGVAPAPEGTQACRLNAFVFNQSTGNIIYAPDFGLHLYAKEYLALYYTERKQQDIGYLVVFEASSMVIFDALNPLTLATPRATEVGGAAGAGGTQAATVYTLMADAFKYTTHVSLESFGTFLLPESDYSVAVLFAPPDEPIEIVLRSPGATRYPLAMLINSTKDNPSGYGYILHSNQQFILTHSSLRYAEEIYNVNEDRLRILASIDSREYETQQYELHEQIGNFIQTAKVAIDNHNYSESVMASFLAWRLARETYLYARLKIEDSAASVPILAFLLIPFVLLFEKLIINASGKKKILSFITIFVILSVIFYSVHPGFSLAVSPPMIIIGFSVLILVLPILAVTVRGGLTYAKTIRIRLFGKHEAEIGRASTAIWAYAVGVENMRRRMLRTLLVLTAVILLVTAFVNLASLNPLSVMSKRKMTGQPLYTGVYIRRPFWGGGVPEIGETILEYLTAKYRENATIVPRAWAYTQYSGYTTYSAGWRLYNPVNQKSRIAQGLLGLTSQENYTRFIEDLLVKGRWLLPQDRLACILGQGMADSLGVDVLDTIDIATLNFTVVGIIRDDIDFIRDLDGEGITPLKMDWLMAVNPLNVHLMMSFQGDGAAIIPYETCLSLGREAYIASVSVIPKNPNETEAIAEEIFNFFSEYYVYYSTPDQNIWLLSKAFSVALWGIESQVILWVILSISLLNIMLGSVYERIREINIYGALGLNPMHAALTFLAEATVYAMVGGTLGYVLAMSFNKLISVLYPGVLIQNFSSKTVINALMISMASVIVSTIYPMYKTSKILVPSLERAWKVPTKPKGNSWNIPFPFQAASEKEVNGILAYLQEFLEAHTSERPPDFAVTDLSLETGKIEGALYKGFKMTTRLFPYEAGIVQRTRILFIENRRERRWLMEVLLERVSGLSAEWERANRNLLDLLRKQLLIWRTFTPKEREAYINRFITETPPS